MRIREILLRLPKKYLHLKIFNIVKFVLFRRFQLFKLPYAPLMMDIEPTTGCNFRCTMCDVSSPNWVTKNMKIDVFKKIIDMNKQLLQIKLQGMGEPFVNKHYLEFIKYASNYGIFVQFVTNGSLLTDKIINSLYERNNISKINISIDGATKKTFEGIRIRSNFDDVVNNTYKLINKIKTKEINKRPIISALSLIQKENFHEAEQIMNLCKSLGFDDLSFQVQLTGWGKKDWENINKEKDINYNNNANFFAEIIKKARKINFPVRVIEENLLSKDNQCSYPWDTPYINTEGNVTPCCMIPDPEVVSLGSTMEKNFSEIWNSDLYQSFRKDIKNHNLREYCKNCYKSRI